MTNSHLSSLIDIVEERSLIVDLEGEDAVLIWQLERRCEESRICGFGCWLERQAVKRRKHGEFELQVVVGWHYERDVVGVGILGDFDREGLESVSTNFDDCEDTELTTSFLMRYRDGLFSATNTELLLAGFWSDS